MLPTLLTLGNLCLGFAAAYCCARELQELGAQRAANVVLTRNSQLLEDIAPTFLSVACWLLIGAMICDALDGRVARITGQASKFGEQMDSLADVVSFGVAPALVMVTLVHREVQQWGYAPFGFDRFGQAAMLIGVIYVSCTALRLARFTVEASAEEATHEGFRGLPSPGAAAALLSIIFLHEHLEFKEWIRTAGVFARILPIAALGLALLMVSRLSYRHAVSAVLRRRPFWHVVPFLFAVAAMLLYTEWVCLIASWSFVASGAVRWAWRRVKGPKDREPDVNENDRPVDTVTRQQA